MMLAVTVVIRRSAVVRCTSAPSGTAISSPSTIGISDSRRWITVSAHGVVEVGEQIAHSAHPSFRACGRCSFSAASTSSARTPPISWPSSSTATPSPVGEDSAASSACRSVPSGRKKRSAADGAVVEGAALAVHVDALGVDPRERRAVGLMTSTHSSGPECERVDVVLGDVLDVVQRQPRRVAELQAAVAAVGADEARRRSRWPGSTTARERVVVLLQHAAAAEHRDLVAELDRLVDVVGDEHDRLAQFALQPQDLVLQLLAHHRVDGAERLVHQQDRRVGGQRPGHADALLLAARQLGRVAVGQLGVQPDAFQHARARLCVRVRRDSPRSTGTVATLSTTRGAASGRRSG